MSLQRRDFFRLGLGGMAALGAGSCRAIPTSGPTGDTLLLAIDDHWLTRSGTASATTQRCSQRGRRDSHLSRPLQHRHGLRPGKPARAPLRSKSDGRRRHPGARASRPHAIPLRAAQFPCDAAPGHPAGGNGMGSAEAGSWRRCRSSRVEEMAEAVPRIVRAGRPRSRVGFIP